MLERVNLSRAADRPARTLSRGMLQRLAIGRVLLTRPQLLLLDEPYTGLDRDGVALLTRLLDEERRRGAILAVITHDLDALAPICDHAAVLHRGRLTAERRFPPGTCDGAALLALYQQASVRGKDRDRDAARAAPGPAPEVSP
jgi:heme exporter protein A